MKMEPIVSSNLESTGHEGDTMHVKMKSGKTYAYSPVSAKKHADLRAATSPGGYLNRMGITGVVVPDVKAA
jgi:hypothetical protein